MFVKMCFQQEIIMSLQISDKTKAPTSIQTSREKNGKT